MSNEHKPTPRTKNSLADYFALGEVGRYFFRKKDPNAKPNVNLRMMHGVNKLSMLMFIIGTIFFIIKLLIR